MICVTASVNGAELQSLRGYCLAELFWAETAQLGKVIIGGCTATVGRHYFETCQNYPLCTVGITPIHQLLVRGSRLCENPHILVQELGRR